MTKRLKGLRYLLLALGFLFAANLLLSNQQAGAQPSAAAPSSAPLSAVPITTANDGFDKLPIGLKGLSSSTLVNMGRIRYAPQTTASSDGSNWVNPFSPLLDITWGPARSASGATAAGEPAAGMHPTDPNKALVSGNSSVDSTTDGGNTWTVRTRPNSCSGGDVVNTWLGPSYSGGNEALETCLNNPGGGYDFTCGRSTDGGVTWTTDAGCGPSVSTTPYFDDRQYMWVDRSPTSPFYQRVYLTEALFDNGGTGSYNSVTLRWSSDGGHTWSPPGSNPLPIVDAAEFSRGLSGNHNEFPSMGIAPDGTIGYAWHRGLCCGSSVTVGTNNKVAFARSTDGGVTFPFSNTIVTVPQNQSVVFNSTSPLGVRWSDMPNITADPVDGTFYAIWTQYRTASTAASSAIHLSKSTDNGNTWSTPVIPFNNPNGSIFQGWGWVNVTPDHSVHVTYLGGTTSNTAVAQFYVQSTDGGATWTTPFQLSTGTFGAFGTTTDYEANSVGGYTGANAGSILAAWATTTHNARIGTFVLGPSPTPTSTATPCSPVPCTDTPTATSTNTSTPSNTLPPTNTPTITPTRTTTLTRTITPTRTITLTRTITSTPTTTPTAATCGPNSNYVIAQSTGASIVPGTTDIGNHTDDGTTTIALPFAFTFYGASFSSANVSSNGNIQFTSNATAFTNACLPTNTLNNVISPHWDDLLTNGTGGGIFTSTSGSTPNQIFNIEWRACIYSSGVCGGSVNFEIRLYETTGEIDFVYGVVTDNGGPHSTGDAGATIGVQRGTGPQNTQFSCNTASLSTGLQLAFTQPPCGSPTNTFTPAPPTNTFTPVPPTNTFTPIPTATCPPITVDVSIEDFDFNPQNITVNVGTTVRWTNTGSATHTSTSDTAIWDSGNLGTGQQFSFTFNSVGSFPYHCTVHPFMTGTINVIAGCAPTPTNTPLPTNTFTNTPIPTNTPTNTSTNTAVPPTNTPINTSTNTPVPPTNTPTNTNTSVPTSTNTSTPANINAYAHLELAGPAAAPMLGAITMTQGSRVDLDLFVNAGTNSINAAQNYMTFTNSIIQNVNVTQPGCVVTSTITGDFTTFEAQLQNETCNGPGNCVFRGITVGPGSMAYASGALSNCPSGCTGDFRVARVAFCAVAVGDGLVHWQFSPPAPITRDSEIVDNNSNVVSNPALYTDLVIHVTAQVNNNLVGHVTWQGRPAQPNTLQALPITLTLKAGGTEVDYPVQNTDASGFFTVSVNGLANGTYSWRVKGPDGVVKTQNTDPPGFLANSGTLTLAGAPTTTVEMGLMKAGDANNDNVVNISDDNILKGSFGKSSGQPGYDNRADFTGDGTVNISDFNLMKANFGQAGSPPLTPGSPVMSGDQKR